MSPPEVLIEGVVFGESPRWHAGRLWFSDWGAHQVIALDPGGGHEAVVSVPSFPLCIDFLPDGRLLLVDSARRLLLRREPGWICADSEGAVWYADVGSRRCVRMREGGEVLDIVSLDRGAFACAQPGGRPASVRRRRALRRIPAPRRQRPGRRLPGPRTRGRTA